MPPPTDGLPLVSCIMPTCDRRRFLPAAIRYFLRQDFPNKELVIVDDGADAVGDLASADARIRYVRLSRRATVGAKRNLACEHAAGDLIAHWDDDDWHAPRRLRCQVESLLNAKADLCGLTNLLFYDTRTGQAWRYAYPDDRRPWLSGSSLLYTRAYWAGCRFPESNVGEDAHFVGRADPRRLVAFPDPTIHVGIIHGQNVGPKQTGGVWWRPHPVEDLRGLLGDDWFEYQPQAVPARPPACVAPSLDNVAAFGTQAGERSTTAVSPFRNVFACLVHESPECIVDLVRNLCYLDPASTVLLYNGSDDSRLLNGLPLDRYAVEVHPTPRPMRWGRLHDFALDCMRFALERTRFDALTIVDSDQLALRPNYSARLGAFLAAQHGTGLLGNSPAVQPPGTNIPPARVAHAEMELWRPLLRRFPDGESKFVHWSFWPSTVFTAEAARALVQLFDEDAELQTILRRTRIWATEEVVLPTLTALLGYRVVANPCSYELVQYRTAYSAGQLDAALERSDVYWMHPAPRRYDDPLRRRVRAHFNDYSRQPPAPSRPEDGARAGGDGATTPVSAPPPLPLTLPILARMRTVEGWLDDDEADLLIAAAVRALNGVSDARAVVEVGSYCGRATVVLGSVVQAVSPAARVWAVDPHDGKVGAADRFVAVGPTLEKLRANLARAGVANVVEVVRAAARQVAWKEPIALLLIDGLHDYANVSQDFAHFGPWVAQGGFIAFHDYAGYFPGVVALVDELLGGGEYRKVQAVKTMVLLQKLGPQASPAHATRPGCAREAGA